MHRSTIHGADEVKKASMVLAPEELEGSEPPLRKRSLMGVWCIFLDIPLFSCSLFRCYPFGKLLLQGGTNPDDFR